MLFGSNDTSVAWGEIGLRSQVEEEEGLPGAFRLTLIAALRALYALNSLLWLCLFLQRANSVSFDLSRGGRVDFDCILCHAVTTSLAYIPLLLRQNFGNLIFSPRFGPRLQNKICEICPLEVFKKQAFWSDWSV